MGLLAATLGLALTLSGCRDAPNGDLQLGPHAAPLGMTFVVKPSARAVSWITCRTPGSVGAGTIVLWREHFLKKQISLASSEP